MREVHVFFMYVAYPAFLDVFDKMQKGERIIVALRFALMAMHLTKGSSPYVSINLFGQ